MSRRLFKTYCMLAISVLTLIILSACNSEYSSEQKTTAVPITDKTVYQTGLTPPKRPFRLIIDNVNVITMLDDEADVLQNQRVVIIGQRINAIGDAISIPLHAEDKVIDGQNGFLTPGLIDAHAHFRHESGDLANVAEVLTSPAQMSLFLQQGITTVRNFSGTLRELQWRDKVNAGDWLGTRMISSGPIISLYEPEEPMLGVPHDSIDTEFLAKLAYTWPTSEVETKTVVEQQKALNYDFVKVYSGVTEQNYLQIAETAKTQGLFLSGHIPNTSMENVLAHHNEIAHLSEIIVGKDHVDPDMDDEAYLEWVIDTMLENQISLVFNWSTDEVVAKWSSGEDVYQNDIYRNIPDALLAIWQQEPQLGDADPQYHDLALSIIKQMVEAGIEVQVGSDTSDAGSVPALLLRDMELMVEAGLSPKQALAAATKVPAKVIARILQQPQDRGLIKPEYLADLVLFDKNPLVDIQNLKSRTGVVIDGHWFAQSELDEMAHAFSKLPLEYLELPQ